MARGVCWSLLQAIVAGQGEAEGDESEEGREQQRKDMDGKERRDRVFRNLLALHALCATGAPGCRRRRRRSCGSSSSSSNCDSNSGCGTVGSCCCYSDSCCWSSDQGQPAMHSLQPEGICEQNEGNWCDLTFTPVTASLSTPSPWWRGHTCGCERLLLTVMWAALAHSAGTSQPHSW